MRRTFWILIGVLLTSGGLAVFSFRTAQRVCVAQGVRPTDDLEWLRVDFQLSDAELARIRGLHDGYLPQCQHYCSQIAARRSQLAAELASRTNVTARAEALLAEIAELRAACQAEMLRHFAAVSREMPPEQGQRYLAEMRRATLGHHGDVESSMAGGTDITHGHH